jgi:hypothetical protein
LGGSLRQKGTIEVSAEMNEDDFIFNSSKWTPVRIFLIPMVFSLYWE